MFCAEISGARAVRDAFGKWHFCVYRLLPYLEFGMAKDTPDVGLGLFGSGGREEGRRRASGERGVGCKGSFAFGAVV